MPALKLTCLLSWAVLLSSQLLLFLPGSGVTLWLGIALVAALLVPLRGLVLDRLYTYRWSGFLTLVYLCIGISELVVNPGLRLYAFATVLSSLSLFLSTIYRARALAIRSQG